MQNVFKRLPANMDQGSGQSWYEEDTFSAELHHDVPNILPFAIRRDENTTLRIYYHILFVPSSFLVGGFSIYLPWPLELAVSTTLLCVPSPHCTQTRCCRPRSECGMCAKYEVLSLPSRCSFPSPESFLLISVFAIRNISTFSLLRLSSDSCALVPHLTWEEK